jgi:hypothetical protein
MKYKILTAIAIACLPLMAQAQIGTFYNNGSVLQINGNANVQINGELTNQAGSNLVNNGSIIVLGNVVNNQTMPTANTGSIYFSGNAAQIVSGTANLFAYNAYINNAQGLVLNNGLSIDNSFNFTNGIVTASNAAHPLLFTANGNTIAANNNSHVNGFVVKQGAGSFTYPVGNGSNYQPIAMALTTNSAGMQVSYNAIDASIGTFTTTGTEATPLIAYNAFEHWNTAAIGTATGNVTINWDAINNVGITNIADLKVAHQLGGNWLNEGTTGSGTIGAGNVTSNSISTWGKFTLGSINATSPLPIVWGNFDVTKVNNTGLLKWNTIIELNTKNFEVQRSIDGRTFVTIGIVTAKGYASEYSFVDEKTYAVTNYYRLKEVDVNGKVNLSVVKQLSFNNYTLSISIYPNPATNVLNIKGLINGLNNVIITDMLGKVVIQLNHTAQKCINVANLNAGTYFIKINNESSIKFIKE